MGTLYQYTTNHGTERHAIPEIESRERVEDYLRTLRWYGGYEPGEVQVLVPGRTWLVGPVTIFEFED